jgi:cytochrome bd-type quinol oxidase subunit 1
MPDESSGQLVPASSPAVVPSAVPPDAANVAVTLAKIHETGKTIRTAVIVAGFVAVVGITAWAFVRIYNHDFWLEVLILFCGPGGAVSILLGLVLWLVKRKLSTIQKKLEEVGPS